MTVAAAKDLGTPTSEATSVGSTPLYGRSPRVRAGPEGGAVHVRVAARVRPLLPLEKLGPGKAVECIEVSTPALAIGKNCFTFDRAFSSEASQEDVYKECVEPLVEATLEGVNGTLLAYGQTGSGKTYTMGTSGSGTEPEGALQRALRAIFTRAQDRDAEGASATSFRVSYVEIVTDASRGNTEEIRDLLHPGNGQHFASLKADVDGQVKLEGVMEHEVWTAQEAFTLLAFGSTSRTTCSTRMNDASSRSHALFALELVQRRLVMGVPSTLTAKFQFVDLAGSEKVKLSGVEGEQLSQAININHGLFVLGRVITGLTDGHHHVPFRESKLTRILQNSLGGNSRTCMIACVSPSDRNIADSISTLTYAAKAKEITNKPVVNKGSSCSNCARLQETLERLQAARAGEAFAPPRSERARGPLLQQECLHDCVFELERETARLRRENGRLVRELEACGQPQATVPSSPCGSVAAAEEEATDAAQAGEAFLEGARRKEAEERAARAETLFVRCSERLAALQAAARAAELAVDEALLNSPTEEPSGVSVDFDELDDEEDCSEVQRLSTGSAGESLNFESADLTWLEQEAGRKHRLLLQVEENQHVVATLEAQAQERIRQHEAQRDIAERELARLQSELDAARSREEQLTHLQECYDRRLAALQERNVALERERKEVLRLRTMQKKQETRLKVLQDSIRQVKGERDQMKNQLAVEVQRRKEQEVKGKRERTAAQEKIRTLSARVAALNRCDSCPGPNRLDAVPQPIARRRGSLELRPSPLRGRPPGSKEVGGPWERLLQAADERSLRERQLSQAQAKLRSLEAQALGLAAQRERLSVEAEVEGAAPRGEAGSTLAALETETMAVTAAFEYQREQVWMLQREFDACSVRDPAEAAARLAESLNAEQQAASLAWLCTEAARQRVLVALAHEAREATEAEVAACRGAVIEARQRVAKQEQANDLLQSDYESRVANLLACVKEGGAASEGLQEALGEDAVALLSRRVTALEEQLGRERAEAKEKGQQRLEKDVELITGYREKDSEIRLLRSNVQEAEAKAERALARGAQREAQLQDKLAKLEVACSENTTTIGEQKQVPCVEKSWGLELLEDFWRSTGLTENREELVESLRADVQALCKQKLHDHLEWKRELEERVAGLHVELAELDAQLGEQAERPAADANLLDAARVLEASISQHTSLRDARRAELLDLASRAVALRCRLHGDDQPALHRQLEGPGALGAKAVEEARQCCEALEALERERREVVVAKAVALHGLWEEIGLRIPEELDEQEAALLQEPLPVSDDCIVYLDARYGALTARRDELEVRRQRWQETLQTWRLLLGPFALPLPEPPEGLPLAGIVEALKGVVADMEIIARDFVHNETLSLGEFFKTSALQNVGEVHSTLEHVEGVVAGLEVLGRNWERLIAQREEHRRIVDLIRRREALEAKMRQFDVEASDPNRFKKRGYSGVQENKTRAEHQRQLRLLDASLTASTAEWLQREAAAFCIGGVEYRGSELLPTEHTHMYAWTNKQMAHKQAAKAGSGEFQPPARGAQRNSCGQGRPPTGRSRAQSDVGDAAPRPGPAKRPPLAGPPSSRRLTS